MPSLFLHAVDPLWRPARADDLISVMQDCGFAGALRANSARHEFLAGDEFLRLVMFLGCSPQVTLDPGPAESGQPLCFIRLQSFRAVTRLCADPQPAVRCPSCRAPAQRIYQASFDDRYVCTDCGHESAVHALDWRQAAGFARWFVQVEGIHAHEAVPSDPLLNTLGKLSHCAWKYFYA